MSKFLIISLIVICLIPCACSPRNENEIVGTYLYENSQEQEMIILNPDNTYIRSYLEKQNNQSRQEAGTWKYEHIGGPHVSLNYCESENPQKCRGESKAIEKWFGKMYLGMDEDGARLYRKQD